MRIPVRVRLARMAAVCMAIVLGPLVAGCAGSNRARPRAGRAVTTVRASHRVRPGAGRLVWSDEFVGPVGAPPAPGKWQAVTGGGGWGNRELESYTARASNVALDGNGHLAITARVQTPSGGDRVRAGAEPVTRGYTSARLQTKGLFSIRYGTLEARIQVPQGAGLWPAFWALGADIDSVGWPRSGEIDVMENIGSDPFTIYGSIHGPYSGRSLEPYGRRSPESYGRRSPKPYGLAAPARSPASLAAGFHVYGVTRTPDRIVFSLDGVPYSTLTPASLSAGQQWVFDKPFFLLLNLAVGGTWPGSPTAKTRFPATMLVDWVRVYR